MDDTRFWVALTRIPGIGTARFRLLERAFGTMEAAWRASLAELRAAGLDERSAGHVVSLRSRVDPDAEMERLVQLGARAITWHNREYPPLLREISDAPPVLFLLGALTPEDERAVTVVGTRHATAYGREVCLALVRELALNGVTIVSGLARGIDGVAHRAALDAGGRNIAVLGSGLDVMYPPEHRGLAEQIVAQGAVMTEHPLGTKPDARNFPRRNRIMSGMSLGVLVVEAPEASGAMWTVHWALEQGRDVFAVPGSLFSPASRGANRLIQEGAKLVLDYKDILEELNLSTLGRQAELPGLAATLALSDLESRLLRYIGHDPVHIDEVRRQVALPVAAVSSTLAVMEIKGLVKQMGGMHYIRARELPVEYQPVS